MEAIRCRLGFDYGSYVEPEGLLGGLALWWNKEVNLVVEIAEKNFMHVAVTECYKPARWEATFVYGCPLRAGRGRVWDELKTLAQNVSLPWLCMGDFNQVLSIGDKYGGHVPSQKSLSAFHELITDCGLVDLEAKGPRYTWRNNRSGENFIMERIDMAFTNASWRELYDQAMVFVEATIGSDHNPLVLDTNAPLNKVGKPFRFESFWVTEDECKGVIDQAWTKNQEGAFMFALCKKLRVCKESLKEWNKRTFGNLRLKIAASKDQLIEIQKQLEQGFNFDLVEAEKRLKRVLEDLWQKAAMYWHQRLRIKWLQMGDRNSRLFHLSTIQRRQRNQIMRLKDKNEVWRNDPKEIAERVRDYFNILYEEPPAREFEDLISLIDPIITPEWNAQLVRTITREEVKLAAFQMGPLKAPGSDGFPGIFYQTYWDTVGEDVFSAVQSFFNEGIMLKEVNQTNIILIPKRDYFGTAVGLHP
ncbi:hypothetical protein Vadar_019513 [Vaccinium darrowii]|uniref:Uncharacterized protein n=1 Tax=Vaccinium darrowii TaxID=229202 RepID=A0ACB7ZDQ9_9ERIC|nr:hypothetical protein Vadar_019513 [Vaccinium darrowii]